MEEVLVTIIVLLAIYGLIMTFWGGPKLDG